MRRHGAGAQETAPLFIDPEKELKRAKNTAYRYLAIRSRSRKEVEQKLADRGFSPDCIATVMEHLLRLGYLDDERFARDWAAGRVRTRGYGRRRIEQELRDHGISTDTIRQAMRDLFQDVPEQEVARRSAEKKLRTLSRLDPDARRRRLAGHLERRGFSPDVIYRILRALL